MVPVRQEMYHRFARPESLVVPERVLFEKKHINSTRAGGKARPYSLSSVVKADPLIRAHYPFAFVDEFPCALASSEPVAPVAVVAVREPHSRKVVVVPSACGRGRAAFGGDNGTVGEFLVYRVV